MISPPRALTVDKRRIMATMPSPCVERDNGAHATAATSFGLFGLPDFSSYVVDADRYHAMPEY